MDSIIKKLPDSIANKISAGEVVTRPSSAVKELLENSVDAGADEITLIIKESGKSLIQIIDNGCGMNEEDAVMAFERFATSKIKEVDDLENLHTLGFRGEALPSIASVSQIEMKTKIREAQLATMIRMNGGVMESLEKAAAPDGTSIAIKNLYFNVPARRKFLKSNATEFKHIYDCIVSQALANPDIAYTFISDGDEVFKFKDESLLERLDVLYGSRFSESLFAVEETNDFMTIKGYIGKPALLKRTKNDQFLFVNQRVVQHRAITHAISTAYGELLGEREQPFYLLFLSIRPSRVDVNVHPSKMEVKFDDERGVYNMVHAVIRRAVMKMDASPALAMGEIPDRYKAMLPQNDHEDAIQKATSNFSFKRLGYNDRDGDSGSTRRLYNDYQAFQKRGERFFEKTTHSASRVSQEEELSRLVPQVYPEQQNEVVSPPPRNNSNQGNNPELLGEVFNQKLHALSENTHWQLHNKYILTHIRSGLMLIDQHVAHERILYERALKVMNSGIPNSQQLLFPQRVELKPWEMELMKRIEIDLKCLGFSFRYFGDNTVVLEGIPPDVKPGTEERIFHELLEQSAEYQEKLQLDGRDNVAKSYACRSSIMAGDKLSQKEMSTLVDQLFATSMPYVCPHGRPIIIKITTEELDRMFGRT
ncbi:MAG: DNA mismatch repair endonuclease MutL [Chloroherpetonaceae bacterium]|nr:DNA mismatch repair endonuclease MutL [Chloroherpetonaceae bacterium]